jgi:hypothetical protein
LFEITRFQKIFGKIMEREIMRYGREELCRVKDGRLRELIRKKYGGMMAFYGLAAKMCNVSEHALHLFIGSGKRSQKKYAHTVLKMLGLGPDAFDTYFTCEKDSSPSLVISSPAAPTLELSHILDAILHRLNGLEDKVDALINMMSLYLDRRNDCRSDE